MDFERVLHPCSVLEGGKYVRVFVEVKYKKRRLSITGVIGPLRSGNAVGSCGQINGQFGQAGYELDALLYAPGWNRETFQRFLAAWRDWHLNDLHAGCEHQRALG